MHGSLEKTGFNFNKTIMDPLTTNPGFPEWLSLLIAFIIGIGFGFALEQAGFSSSRKLAGMFYGYDTTVIKVFFTASIVALVGSQIMSYLGLLDLSKVYINEYYVHASVIGGIIMGAGFIMGGFCPGTGITAASIGKIDAMFFLGGGFLGAYLFAESWPLVNGIANAGYKGPVRINELFGISSSLFTLLLIMAAIGMFWLSEKAERRFARPDITENS